MAYKLIWSPAAHDGSDRSINLLSLYKLLINSLAAFYRRLTMLIVGENPREFKADSLWRRLAGSCWRGDRAVAIPCAHQRNHRRARVAVGSLVCRDRLR